MPTFRTCIVNREFSACDEEDLPDRDAALERAVKGALQIGMEEVCKGYPFFGAEVTVESGGRVLERRMVAVGVSPLR